MHPAFKNRIFPSMRFIEYVLHGIHYKKCASVSSSKWLRNEQINSFFVGKCSQYLMSLLHIYSCLDKLINCIFRNDLKNGRHLVIINKVKINFRRETICFYIEMCIKRYLPTTGRRFYRAKLVHSSIEHCLFIFVIILYSFKFFVSSSIRNFLHEYILFFFCLKWQFVEK